MKEEKFLLSARKNAADKSLSNFHFHTSIIYTPIIRLFFIEIGKQQSSKQKKVND